MKKTVLLSTLLTVLISPNTFGVIWTETFDNGVGRFSHTNGPGDQWYTWNSSTQSMDATFYRGYTYERYALLGNTYIVGDSILEFSAVVTPLEMVDGSGAAIGFINSDEINTDNRCTVLFATNKSSIRSAIDEGDSGSIPMSAGTTYFVDFLLNGPADRFYLDVYEGTDQNGNFLGTISSAIGVFADLEIDAIGLTNRLSYTIPYQTPVNMNIDNISLIVPEPITLSLFALGGLFLRQKRMGKK